MSCSPAVVVSSLGSGHGGSQMSNSARLCVCVLFDDVIISGLSNSLLAHRIRQQQNRRCENNERTFRMKWSAMRNVRFAHSTFAAVCEQSYCTLSLSVIAIVSSKPAECVTKLRVCHSELNIFGIYERE